MKFKSIELTHCDGFPEALTNMLYGKDITVITDMVEDAKDEKEVYNNLVKLYEKQYDGSILRRPIATRTTETYFRITLLDGCGNKSYLKIVY